MEEIVRIVTIGVQEALAGIESVSIALGTLGGAASKAVAFTGAMGGAIMSSLRGPSQMFFATYQNLRTLSRELQGVAQIASRLAFGGSLGLGAIVTGATRGTVEGQRMADTFHYLARVLGDGFAPYVRAVTAGMMELAQWFRNLSSETRENVAQWAVLTAGTLAFVSTLPLIIRGVGSVAAILGLLTSPAVLVVGAFAVITAAAAKMFGFFESGGADAADALNSSNESWLGSLIQGVGAAVTAIAKMFNWVLQQAAKVSDWIAEQMAKAGEFLGILPEGTVKELGKMPPIQPPQIDIGGVQGFFDKVKRGAGQAEADFGDLIKQLQEGGGLIDRIQQKAKFGQGFQIKMDVKFESLQGTFERLQQALASNTGMGIDQAQLGELQKINEAAQKTAAGIAKIGDMVPAVR